MKRFALALGLGVAVAGYGYTAALRIFTDEAAFLAESGPSTVLEDFSTAPLGSVLPGTSPLFGSLVFSYEGKLDGGQNDPFDGQPLIKDRGEINGSREFMGEVNADGTPSGLHFFTFPYDVSAFGGTFGGATSGSGLTLIVGDETISLRDHLGRPGTGFFGVISDTGFGGITFGSLPRGSGRNAPGSEVFRLDDVYYAEAIPEPAPVIPLPGSVWSLGVGLAALGFIHGRRQRRRAHAQ